MHASAGRPAQTQEVAGSGWRRETSVLVWRGVARRSRRLEARARRAVQHNIAHIKKRETKSVLIR